MKKFNPKTTRPRKANLEVSILVVGAMGSGKTRILEQILIPAFMAQRDFSFAYQDGGNPAVQGGITLPPRRVRKPYEKETRLVKPGKVSILTFQSPVDAAEYIQRGRK